MRPRAATPPVALRFGRRVRQVLLLALPLGFVLHAGIASTAPIWRLEQDARLRKRLTLNLPRAYLGEVLAEITHETGVELRTSEDRFPMSGIEVCCLIREQPAVDVLRSLTALFSDGDQSWEWASTLADGRRRYRLVASRSPREVAQAREARIRQQWEADAWTVYRVARQPSAERAALAARRPDLFARLTGPESWACYLALGELTEAEFRTALGGGSVSVPISRVSADTRRLMESRFRATGDQVRTSLRFERDRLAPTLSVGLGQGYFSVLGDGWWHQQWMLRNAGDWRGPTHPETEAATLRILRLKPEDRRPLGVTRASQTARLEAVHKVEGLSILGDVFDPRPGRAGRTGGYWRGLKPEDTLISAARPDLCWRRRADIWLVRGMPRWTDPREYLVPWTTTAAIRKAADAHDGYLRLDELAAIARLRPAQWLALREEFPDADPKTMSRWAPVFGFWSDLDATGKRKLASTTGLRLAQAGAAARLRLFPRGVTPAWPGGEAALLALPDGAVSLTEMAGQDRRGWRWRVFDDPRTLAAADFKSGQRQPLQTESNPAPWFSAPTKSSPPASPQ